MRERKTACRCAHAHTRARVRCACVHAYICVCECVCVNTCNSNPRLPLRSCPPAAIIPSSMLSGLKDERGTLCCVQVSSSVYVGEGDTRENKRKDVHRQAAKSAIRCKVGTEDMCIYI